MSCPTCSHTMENIGQNDRADNFFLCPRCGTVLIDAFGQHGDKVYVPKLVERCRRFGHGLAEKGISVDCLRDNWKDADIPASINLPGER